jgi:hypothetical protein
MAVQIQLRNDTAANWTSNNPTLAVGEMGVETDTDQLKIGDGSTAWASLAYGGIVGPAGTNGTDGADSVAVATSPLAYDAGTKTISIDLSSYDTSSEVDAKVAALVDSAPAALNTLNELAAALGDDSNFATTVTDSIATKSPLLASFVTDATTARTLTSADAGKTIRFTSSSATVVTINASTDLPVGARVDIIADGAGALTVSASSATVAAAETSTTTGSFTIGLQYSAATLLCVATDSYRLIGNVAVV